MMLALAIGVLFAGVSEVVGLPGWLEARGLLRNPLLTEQPLSPRPLAFLATVGLVGLLLWPLMRHRGDPHGTYDLVLTGCVSLGCWLVILCWGLDRVESDAFLLLLFLPTASAWRRTADPGTVPLFCLAIAFCGLVAFCAGSGAMEFLRPRPEPLSRWIVGGVVHDRGDLLGGVLGCLTGAILVGSIAQVLFGERKRP